jgi:prophage regulatory protein
MHQPNANLDPLRYESGQLPTLIRIKLVIALTGISKSYIYDLSNRGLFPKSVQLVPGVGTSVAWVRSEVLAWIESRILQRDEETI